MVDAIQFDAPKTKDYVSFLNNLNVEGKVLVVTADSDPNVYRSGRNVKGSSIVAASELSTYDVMRAGTIVMAEGAIDKLKEQFA